MWLPAAAAGGTTELEELVNLASLLSKGASPMLLGFDPVRVGCFHATPAERGTCWGSRAAADPAALLVAQRALESLHCLLLLGAFCVLATVEHLVA